MVPMTNQIPINIFFDDWSKVKENFQKSLEDFVIFETGETNLIRILNRIRLAVKYTALSYN